MGYYEKMLFLCLENNYFTNYFVASTPYVIGNNPEEVKSEPKDLTLSCLIVGGSNNMHQVENYQDFLK